MLSNKQLYRRAYKKQQQGFVLVLALVMLTVLTLIGVSSMNSANMELKSTANAQQHQIAFDAVQALLEFSVSEDTTVDYQPSSLTTTQNVSYTFADATSLAAVVTYSGCNVGVGSSLEGGSLSYNFFDIKGTGANASGSATSSQTQGIRFPSASCDPTLVP